MQLTDKIILGTVQLGLDYGINNKSGKPSQEEAVEILDSAYTNGIRMLDTAEAYGTAQNVIGSFHKLYDHKRFRVITKCKAEHAGIFKEEFRRQFFRNLDILHVEQLFGYLFHSFDHYRHFEHWDVLQDLLDANVLAKIGVSVYTNEQVDHIKDDARISIVQLPFNLLDNKFYRGKALEDLKAKGKEVHVRSVFLQGLFFKERELTGKLSPLGESLLKLDTFAVKASTDIGTLALGYALSQSQIDKVLVGVESKNQLKHNIEMLSSFENIPSGIYSEIDELEVEYPYLLNPVNW